MHRCFCFFSSQCESVQCGQGVLSFHLKLFWIWPVVFLHLSQVPPLAGMERWGGGKHKLNRQSSVDTTANGVLPFRCPGIPRPVLQQPAGASLGAREARSGVPRAQTVRAVTG